MAGDGVPEGGAEGSARPDEANDMSEQTNTESRKSLEIIQMQAYKLYKSLYDGYGYPAHQCEIVPLNTLNRLQSHFSAAC